MPSAPGTKTIIEIEYGLKTKDSAYMLLTTKPIDSENIVALFIPIALKINLTKRKRYRLLKQQKFLSANFEKARMENTLVFMKLCWVKNISKTDVENVFDTSVMEPTQINVERHFFEVLDNNYLGEEYV